MKLEVIDPIRSPDRMNEAVAAYGITLVRDLILNDARTDDKPAVVENADMTRSFHPNVKVAVADDMATRSLSFSNALQDLGTLLNRIAIAQTVPAAVPDELPEREDVLRLASLFTPEDIQLCYQIVVHGRHELGLAPDEYAGFTMTLLRMLAFAPGGAVVAA